MLCWEVSYGIGSQVSLPLNHHNLNHLKLGIGYIAQGLTYFDWIVWIAPNNLIVNQIFGNQSGFGLVSLFCSQRIAWPNKFRRFRSHSIGLL
jgi:hypothetical protein